ncbi:putative translation initiation factor IF-2, N-terminal region [Trypoxylus dichotomus]
MEPYVIESLPIACKLKHDNDPRRPVRTVKQWLEEKHITVLDCPVPSSDLNPIENVWENAETVAKSNSPTCLDDLWSITEEAWHSVQAE